VEMMQKIEIVFGDQYSQLIAPSSIVSEVRSVLRYENDVQVRRSSGWKVPQYNYLMKSDGVFFSGLFSTVVKLLKVNDIKFEIRDLRRITESPSTEDILARLKSLKYIKPPVKLRDYQTDAVLKGLDKTRGIIEAATGAGKSVILAALILAWYKKTLVLVDSKDLAHQLREELGYFLDEPIGLIGSGVYDEQRVTVGMVQTLSQKRGSHKNKKIAQFLSEIEYLCMDECHHVQSKTWRQVIKSCSSASIFHGFTATPYTSKVKCEDGSTEDKNILLKAYIGPSITKIKTSYLIEQGWLAKPSITFINNSVYWDEQPLDYMDEYTRIIVEDEERNRIACKIIQKYYREGRQCIGFITRIDHGDIISRMLVDEFGVEPEDVAFVTGEIDSGSRKGQLKSFKEGRLPILLGTVLNEGLNFFCDMGINISGGNSIKSTIQRLGRVLRKAKDPNTGDVNRSLVELVDYYEFCDAGHPYFQNHSENRKMIYMEEGHEVKIISEEEI
jgi:superfamily II DNA or RNA helicase